MEVQRVYLRGKKLQKILSEKSVTQAELAQMIDMDMSYLSKAIHNKVSISIDKVDSICNLLQINKREIINETKQITGNKNSKITIIPGCKWNDEYFRKMLKKKNLSIVGLSRIIKKDKTIYSAYKLGKIKPSIETLKRIVEVLECSTTELIGVSEDELNDIAGCKIFTDERNTQDGFMSNKELSTLSVEDNLYDYKHFESQNVIENMNIINENILLLVKNITDYKNIFDEKMSNLTAINENLLDRIELLEKNIKSTNVINTSIMDPSKVKLKPVTLWGNNNHCSEKELKEIVNSSITTDDCNTYKQKIYKMISFISKKKNLIFNQILHDSYNQFSRIYGFNCNELKKETGTSTTLDAIYENTMCREIFFNMVCKNATEQ